MWSLSCRGRTRKTAIVRKMMKVRRMKTRGQEKEEEDEEEKEEEKKLAQANKSPLDSATPSASSDAISPPIEQSPHGISGNPFARPFGPYDARHSGIGGAANADLDDEFSEDSNFDDEDIDERIEAEAEEDSKSSSLGRRMIYLWHVLSHRLGFARRQVPMASFKSVNSGSRGTRREMADKGG